MEKVKYWQGRAFVWDAERGKRIPRSRHVMEKHLSRKLSPKEIVHHINEDKLDDRIENLQLMEWGAHTSGHKKLTEEERQRRIKARSKKYYAKNKENFRDYELSPAGKARAKNWRDRNKGKLKLKRVKHYKKNQELLKEQTRVYYAKNRDSILKKQREKWHAKKSTG